MENVKKGIKGVNFPHSFPLIYLFRHRGCVDENFLQILDQHSSLSVSDNLSPVHDLQSIL